MIGILDYGVGNLHSVYNALKFLRAESKIISDGSKILDMDSIIIPGVGSFQKAMEKLNQKNMVNPIIEFANNKKPVLGICLGMQLLATKGYESQETMGLNLIPGEVKLMNTPFRLPHVGWNGISLKKESKLFRGVKKTSDFYFVHSYHFISDEENVVLTSTDYGFKFTSCVNIDNIYGIQFHPEKSQKQGLKILRNYIDLLNA
jgi:glutamine amidotransferase